MRTEVIQLTILAISLILGGAAEELLPKCFGVGFPVLLAASLFVAMRRCHAVTALAFAVAAGAAEDALSSLPALTGIAYFLLTVALTRWTRLPREALVLAYPAFQVWLYLWVEGLQGGVFGRLLLSFPVGLATGLAVWPAMTWLERKAAIDEQG